MEYILETPSTEQERALTFIGTPLTLIPFTYTPVSYILLRIARPMPFLAMPPPKSGILPMMGLVLALMLPGPWRIALAGLALMAGTVLVNLTPPNPYSVAALAAWRQGHFLNFNGLTRLTASLWPFLALPALILLGRRS